MNGKGSREMLLLCRCTVTYEVHLYEVCNSRMKKPNSIVRGGLTREHVGQFMHKPQVGVSVDCFRRRVFRNSERSSASMQMVSTKPWCGTSTSDVDV